MVQRVDSSADRRFWLILGEPGAGKSRLLEAWFRRWASKLPSTDYGLTVPILVPLRYVELKFIEDDSDDLADYLWKLGMDARALVSSPFSDTIYQESKARIYWPVWFLDGLDELPSSMMEERFYQKLTNLPGVKVVTCRTAIYESLRTEVDRYKTMEYELLGLKVHEQQAFLKEVFGGDSLAAELLQRKIQKNAQVRLLASNPLMLSLIAKVGARVGLPASRAEFYRAAVREMWHRKLSTESRAADLIGQRDALLTQLAQSMGLDQIEAPYSLLSQTASSIAPHEHEILSNCVKKAGLLRVDLHREKFSFLHLTFQEFYFACALSQQGLQIALEKFWDDVRYEETLGLLISLLYQKNRLDDIDQAIRWLVAVQK